MATGNSITLVGNLTRDPELRFTQSGQPKCGLGIAVNRRWQRNGEWEEATSFFNVVAWGDLGENISESLTKGDRVLVTGRLEQRSWETDQGERRSVVEVVADEIGPSLRWATATPERTERKTGGDSVPAAAPAGAGGGYTPDEEPF